MAFRDLREGILELFGDAHRFVTVDTVKDFKTVSGLGRAASKDDPGANAGISIHDPRAAHRKHHMMLRVRGRCTRCTKPAGKHALCSACKETRRHLSRVARLGENYTARKCGCGCGETLAPNQQKFVSATHKARHWDRVRREQKRAEKAVRLCGCGCGKPLTLGKRRFAETACRLKFWGGTRPK